MPECLDMVWIHGQGSEKMSLCLFFVVPQFHEGGGQLDHAIHMVGGD